MRRPVAHHAASGAAGPRADDVFLCREPGGLLPWQGALLAGVCGIFTLFYPLPGSAALVVLWLSWRLLGGRARTGLGMLAAFGLGVLLAFVRLPAVPQLPGFVGSGDAITLTGVVDEVDPRPDRRLTVLLRDVRCLQDDGGSVAVPGLVSWSWHGPVRRVLPGQSVTLRTRIDPMHSFRNPGSWDYALAQRIRNVHTSIYSRGNRSGLVLGPEPDAPGSRWRNALTRLIAADSNAKALPKGAQEQDDDEAVGPEGITPEQGRAMLAAMLTGDRFALEPQTIDLLRAAGLSHTLALSGLHLGFVVMMGVVLAWTVSLAWPGLLLKLPRPKLALIVAGPMVLGYLWLGGYSPSLLRATLMFAFMAFFLLRGRGRVVIDGLFFALLVILLCDPLAALDIRLQLSAVAVLGIGVFMPPLLEAVRKLPGMGRGPVLWAAGLLCVSLCATLAILPLTARTFGMYAPNLLLNLVWLPLLGFVVMPLGLAGLLLSLASPAWASGCFAAAGWVLGEMLAGLSFVESTGALPLLQLLRPLWSEMLGAGVLLAVLASSLRSGRQGERGIWAAAMLGLALLAGPHVLVMAEDARALRLDVMDVGDGQSLIITEPGGHRTIVDGGGLRSRTFDAGRDVVAPFLTLGRPPRLAHMILTHPHADHYKGLLHLLRYFDVGSFAYGGALPGGSYRKPFRAALAGLAPLQLHAGDSLELGSGLRLDVLHPAKGYDPPSTNDVSLVLRLVHEDQGLALLGGDVEDHAISAFLEADGDIRAPVLVLPHHGSQTSLSPALYARVEPTLALCSSGYRNRAVHPGAQVIAALAAEGCQVRSTWEEGMLRVAWTHERQEGLSGKFAPPEP